MIVVDSSALVAIARDQPEKLDCMTTIRAARGLCISAGTVAEALVVADRRGVGAGMRQLVDDLDFDVRPLTVAGARLVAAAYSRWGKGVHPAGLNSGDCFAYALAKELDCPLLFLGNDFARTDVRSALAERGAERGL